MGVQSEDNTHIHGRFGNAEAPIRHGGDRGRSTIKGAVRRGIYRKSIEATAPIGPSASSPIYTNLTEVTASGDNRTSQSLVESVANAPLLHIGLSSCCCAK
jgi:hypothetical protein